MKGHYCRSFRTSPYKCLRFITGGVSLQDKGRLYEGDKAKGHLLESNSLEGVVTNECGGMTRV